MIIIASIRPFTFAQKILVLNDEGNMETNITTSMKDLPENLCETANKYQCNKITFAGSKLYARGLEKRIKECYMAKYNKEDLKIEYI